MGGCLNTTQLPINIWQAVQGSNVKNLGFERRLNPRSDPASKIFQFIEPEAVAMILSFQPRKSINTGHILLLSSFTISPSLSQFDQNFIADQNSKQVFSLTHHDSAKQKLTQLPSAQTSTLKSIVISSSFSSPPFIRLALTATP